MRGAPVESVVTDKSRVTVRAMQGGKEVVIAARAGRRLGRSFGRPSGAALLKRSDDEIRDIFLKDVHEIFPLKEKRGRRAAPLRQSDSMI